MINTWIFDGSGGGLGCAQRLPANERQTRKAAIFTKSFFIVSSLRDISPPYKGGDAAPKVQLGWSLTTKRCILSVGLTTKRYSVSDHPAAPFLEAAPYRACAVAPPLLRKERSSVHLSMFCFRAIPSFSSRWRTP